MATKYPFFNTKHPVIILRVSLFAVTPSHVASTKIECQNFSYVYRSKKHWECKYYTTTLICNKYGTGIVKNRTLYFKYLLLNTVNLHEMFSYNHVVLRSMKIYLFSHPDDIDLYTGAMSEMKDGNALVGPTFACILGRQFRELKRGDRFWYENPFPKTGFTLGINV